MVALVLHILSMSSPAWAARPRANAMPVMTVMSAGSSDFLRAKYPLQKIEMMNQRSVAAEEEADGYVPPTARTQLFERVGLTAALARYDDLDKDMLVMAVRDADPEEMNRLLKGYPNLKMEQLVRLKAELAVPK
jgi:hypothetical protein